MEDDRYQPHGERYKEFVQDIRDFSDFSLENHFSTYAARNNFDKKRPQHRQWRRLIIREAMRRGLISEDPGGAP